MAIVIDDRPFDMLTNEELDQKFIEATGEPYISPTEEEFEKGLQEAISFGLLTEKEVEKARKRFYDKKAKG